MPWRLVAALASVTAGAILAGHLYAALSGIETEDAWLATVAILLLIVPVLLNRRRRDG